VSDRLIIEGLRLSVRVGAFEEERSRPQEVLIRIELRTDMADAAQSNDLGDAIDYASVLNAVESALTDGSFVLLEAVADRVVTAVSGFRRATGVSVEIEKAAVPVPQTVGRVAVRIER
jgi:7,8-dihydroneopterin aldolase/epimerase/oxygenase